MNEWSRIMVLLVFTALVGAASGLLYRVVIGIERRSQPTLEDRISLLTKSLAKASSAITAVEQEIHARQVMVENLRRDAEVAKQLATLSKEQSEAVVQALELQLKKQESGGFWTTFLMSMFFTLVGVLLSETTARWRARRPIIKRVPAADNSHWPRP